MKLKQNDASLHCEDYPELITQETHILHFLGKKYEIKDIKTRTCQKCGEKSFDGRQILEIERKVKNGELQPIN